MSTMYETQNVTERVNCKSGGVELESWGVVAQALHMVQASLFSREQARTASL